MTGIFKSVTFDIDAVNMSNLVRNSPTLTKIVSELITNNRDAVMELSKTPDTLEYLSDNWKNNYDIVMEYVKNDGSSLKHASIELRNNYDIVKAAVWSSSYAFKYASDEMKNKYDIAKKAISGTPSNIQYISPNSEHFYEFALYAAKESFFQRGPLQDNIKFCTEVLEANCSSYHCVSERLKKNYDILFATTIGINNCEGLTDCLSKERLIFNSNITQFKNHIPPVYTNLFRNGMMFSFNANRDKIKAIQNYFFVRTSNPLNFMKMAEYDIFFVFGYNERKRKYCEIDNQ